MNINPTTPMTDVRILHNVPLDSTYTDTVNFFGSVSEQVAYFQGKTKYSYTNMTPYREQNILRLPIVADKLFDCNYVMFKNGNFGDKWFYAFINDITYININTCQITIEVDVIQTWFFDWTFKPSFVEREHVNNDAIGANIVYDNVEFGDYVYGTKLSAGLSSGTMSIVMCVTADSTGDIVGRIYSNIYSGVGFIFYDANDAGVEKLNANIAWLVANNKKDAILGIYMCPTTLLNPNKEPIERVMVVPRSDTDIGGYVPKNNKLFTYPYNYLMLSTSQGQSVELKYELLGYEVDGNADIKIRTNMSINMEAVAFPKTYAGINDNILYKVGIKDFPMCPYTVDTYMAWLAQNQGFQNLNLASSAVSSIIGIAGSAMTGNPLGMVGSFVGGLGSIASTLETNRIHESMPPSAKGSNTGSAEFANGLMDFYAINVHIMPEYAKIIDDFWSMYGYPVNEVKVPNLVGRPSWNYVKVREPKIVGSVPFDDMAKIKSIYEKGITCWHGDWVGDYTRVNK